MIYNGGIKRYVKVGKVSPKDALEVLSFEATLNDTVKHFSQCRTFRWLLKKAAR